MNICFTGHRPNKLGGYDWNTPKNKQIINKLRATIVSVIAHNINESNFHFIVGGALGIDQMAFNICDELRHLLSDITIEVAVPFQDQPNAWFNQLDKTRYFKQLQFANKVTYVDSLKKYQATKIPIGKYNPYKLQIRNEYMVDNSDLVIAIWDGSKSGTKNCIDYAKGLNKKIVIINPNEI